MKAVATPPAVDRVERTVHSGLLTFLAACLLAAIFLVWLAPRPMSVTIISWLIIVLAFFGAFAVLLFTFGLLQFAGRAARASTPPRRSPTAIPTESCRHRRRIARRLRQRGLSPALGRARAPRDSSVVERLFYRRAGSLRGDLPPRAGGAQGRARASEELRISPPLPGDRARRRGIASACGPSRASTRPA